MGRRRTLLAAVGALALVSGLTLTGDSGTVPEHDPLAVVRGMPMPVGLGDLADRPGERGAAASRSGARPVVPDAQVGEADAATVQPVAPDRPPSYAYGSRGPVPEGTAPAVEGPPQEDRGVPAPPEVADAPSSGTAASEPAPSRHSKSAAAPPAATVAPTPSPSPAPTSPPRPTGVRPGPGTTGVPEGVALAVHEGDLRITTPGAVVEGLEIRGFVEVRAPDVTLRHVVVRGRPVDSPRGLVSVTVEGASVTIERSELAPTTPSPWVDGVRGWGITARGVDVHHVIDGFHLYGDDVLIEDSWVHDHVHFENDPHQGGRPSHDDSVQIQKGSNIRIVGNVMDGAYNTGIQFTQDMGSVSDVVISGNLLGGGGCTVNLAEKGRGPFRGVVVRDNRFLLDTRVPRCAIIAPSTTTVHASGNAFTDGSVARVRSGD